MLRSRVSRKPDFARIAQAMQTPGIDPRVWVCQGYVHEFGIDEEGPFVDVVCVPSEEIVPCRLAAVYAGPGYGFYFPVDVDDEVLIFAPDGDPNSGLICMPRPWSASDPPPQEAIDNPQNILLHAKEGASVNIIVSGDAKINLGDADLQTLTDGVVTGQGIDPFTGASYGALGNVSDIVRAKK